VLNVNTNQQAVVVVSLVDATLIGVDGVDGCC
jgi:hypothetical protein